MIEAELPDGTVLEFPDGTSPAVMQRAVKKLMGAQQPTTPVDTPPSALERARDYVTEPVSRAMEYLPKGFVEHNVNVLGGATGIMRGGANIVGGIFGNSKLGQQIWPTSALNKESLSYTLGELADPVAAATGAKAFQLAGKIPQLARLGSAVPVVQGVVGGAAVGGITGGLSEEGDAGTGAILGGAVGGGIPIVGKGVQKLAQIAEPMTKAGAQTSAGRMIKKVTGDSYNEVLRSLRSPQTPFTRPSVAQATAKVGNADIAALQKLSEQKVTAPGLSRSKAQAANREGLISSFAGDDAQIAAMREARGDAFATNIGDAQQAGVRDRFNREFFTPPPKPVETLVPSNLQPGMKERVLTPGATPVPKTVPILEKLRENPLIGASMTDAKAMASGNLGLPEGMQKLTKDQVQDILNDPMRSLEGLQLMKFSIDNRLKPAMADSATSKLKLEDSTVTNIKSALMQGVKQTGFGGEKMIAANKQFADQSNEIFQRQVGKNMLGLLKPPLGEGETGAKLARAVEAETSLVKKAGGFGREGLEEQLTPGNMAKVRNVIAQLDVDTSLEQLAKKGATSTVLKDATGEVLQLPNTMNQAITVSNGVIRRVFQAGQVRTLRELASVMQDPALAAKLMENATTKEKNALKFMENAMKYYSPYAASQAGSSE